MHMLIVLVLAFISGCSLNENTRYGDYQFIEMEQEYLIIQEHYEMCKLNDSEFCSKYESIGDIYPTKKYAMSVLLKMNMNFKYKNDNYWHYNSSIYENLVGDCEDIASTMAKHMIDDGIDKKYLFLAYRKISKAESHIFLAVDTVDAGLLHLDYANSGYPIEPHINFHMRMDDAGVHKWVKGNIK